MAKSYSVTITREEDDGDTSTAIYSQTFDGLDVPKVAAFLNTLPPPAKPRKSRKDKDIAKKATPAIE